MIGRLAYGALFVVVLPVALIAWARHLDLPLRAPHAPVVGVALVMAGVALWIAGVVALARRGGGPPMIAFPPPRFVATGVYALLAHPIYVGWSLAVFGVALATGSASGLFVVAPCVALGCAALVAGLERGDLERRFGAAAHHRAWLSFPPGDEARPTWSESAAVVLLLFVPWLVAYEAVLLLGVPPDAVDLRFAFEKTLPVWIASVPVYSSAYLVVPLAAFLAPTRHVLRRFAHAGTLATAVVTLFFVAFPVISPYRAFVVDDWWGALLAFDQRASLPPMAALPAFHAIWAALAAQAIGARSRAAAVVAWGWALAVAVSCVTTGMHAIVDVLAAAPLAWLFAAHRHVWRVLLDGTERLANSWRAWRVGPLRIINHSPYPGLAAATGVAGIGVLAGPSALKWVLIVATASLLGGGLWAQLVEGSSKLARPFGYFGSVIGVVLAGCALAFTSAPVAILIAATATVAPWVQAVGRLRCIVQGCCHGRLASSSAGIRVSNPHSRVIVIAELAGQPIHPTPLYSIVSNVVIGAVLLRLWTLGARAWPIVGTYFLLAGLARFVEEGFRGEPQTPRFCGLPLYQHMAIVCVIAGAVLTTLDGGAVPAMQSVSSPALLISALIVGLVHAFAMGMDFPDSNARFARLSG